MSTVDNMNCFEILGVEEGATTEEITAAYKKLVSRPNLPFHTVSSKASSLLSTFLSQALKWHPDRRLNDQENATKKFVEVSAFLPIPR